MADYIIDEKKAVEQLTFLNGEIQTAQAKKEAIENETEDLIKARDAELALKDSQTAGIKDEIAALEKNAVSLGDTYKELENKVAQKTDELKEIDHRVEVRKKELSAKDGDLARREQALEEGQSALVAKEQAHAIAVEELANSERNVKNYAESLFTRDQGLTELDGFLHDKEASLEAREKAVIVLEKENDDRFENNAARTHSIEKQIKEFSEEHTKVELDKADLVKREIALDEGTKVLASKEEAFIKKIEQLDIETKNNSDRETKNILKEEELKIRERKVAIREQKSAEAESK